ncbi:MAG: tRNA 2-thiouridine(34) synthase MnmA [Alphaproteobacteria bacterium]|nr:tRNA 2-thiouridine(34) synthase MnmA [Alphaproteobacteria bacterium]
MSGRSLMNKRVAVALSGGVDSAVTAALLKEQGADVIALTMRLQNQDTPDDAALVAHALSIPLHILDMTKAFEACVIRDFLESYRRGETPVPCAQCNHLIKFGLLMDAAIERGASALATGHYAQRVETPQGVQLHQGADPTKDQSYFLFGLSQSQIDFLRFPLGALTKEETRLLAQRFVLPVAHKKDSQDICFVPDGDYVSVLETLDPDVIQPGDIVDLDGHVLGRHKGIVHFTVGQRKGLDLSDRIGDHNVPLFVLAIDPLTNRVIVGPREALAQRDVYLRQLNWLAQDLVCDTVVHSIDSVAHSIDAVAQGESEGEPEGELEGEPEGGLAVSVRLRSSQKPQSARFYKQQGLLRLDSPAYGVAPGQAGVIYQDSRVLGGGWICRNKISEK